MAERACWPIRLCSGHEETRTAASHSRNTTSFCRLTLRGDVRRLVVVVGRGQVAMRTYDFSPLYRSTVGFDHLFDLLDQTARGEASNWPPYNIERLSDDDYRITMALVGFSPRRDRTRSEGEHAARCGPQ